MYTAVSFTLFLVFVNARVALNPIPPSKSQTAAYPDWAHDHWIWLHNSVSSQDAVYSMVQGYLSRGIKVGAVDIDSGWSTGFNNFVFDTKKFPNATKLVQDMHAVGIRVILWATTMVDTDSPNYQEGKQKNYYLNDGATIKWWHGSGSFIDYTNPDGMKWWHSQMDNVINIGIDGWKCDGTDPYIFELIVPYGYAGIITQRDYANDYYRDFFYYTRKTNPDALIMSRPVDSFDELVYWNFSPRDVVLSGWVGDQDDTFEGLQNAVNNIFESAFQNYVNFGSDIGGYRTPKDRTQSLFLRWAQFGAFMPLMENGGGGNHFPWLFDNATQTTEIYKNFVDIHYQLKPYLLNAGTTAYNTGVSAISPLSKSVILPHRWDYMLWTDIYIAIIVEDSLQRTVSFPQGNDWIYWFDTSRVYSGGSSGNFTFPLEEFPAFQRKGSILPLRGNYRSSINRLVGSNTDGIVVMVSPVIGRTEETVVRRWNDLSTDLSYSYNSSLFEFKISATSSEDFSLLVHHVKYCPKQIQENVYMDSIPKFSSEEELANFGWGYFCDENSRVYIRFSDLENGAHIVIPNLEVL